MDEIQFVECPECGTEQADMGRGVECEECGYGPMPIATVRKSAETHHEDGSATIEVCKICKGSGGAGDCLECKGSGYPTWSEEHRKFMNPLTNGDMGL